MYRLRLGAAAAMVVLAAATAAAQFGGFGRPEQKVVGQFDRDGDGRLNTVERRAARNYLEGQRGRGRRNFLPAAVSNGERIVPADIKPPYPSTPLYDTGTLRTLFIDFPGLDWEHELETFYNTDVEVPASVIIDGTTYDQVGIHFRGNSSYRQVPEGYKRSLNLAFDYVHGKQNVRGYRTLNLLNSHEDPTFLRTVLSQDIARGYLPALKSNFVRVVINGENWGIYVSNQQFNKDFIGEWYPTDDGARWKVPGSPRGRAGLEYWGEQNLAQYKRTFEIKSKDTPKAWADLINLTKVLNETPPGDLEAALKPVLDVDEVLKFLAVDIVLTNGDGYWARGSDYSLYQDVNGRFHVFPGDMNETFSEGGRGFGFSGALPSATLDPLTGLNDPSKPLRSKLLAVPALRSRYLGYVRDIATKRLDWNRIGPLAARYQTLIASEVEADTRRLDAFEEFPADIDGTQRDLRGFIERRRLYLLSYTPR